MVSYKELIGFVWRFMRRQKWTFFSILIQDCLNCLDLLLWPFLLRWVIDIFTLHEENRMLAWAALKTPIIASDLSNHFDRNQLARDGFLHGKSDSRNSRRTFAWTMFDHVQHHSPHYFNERFAGSLANKITDMTTQVESILQQFFGPSSLLSLHQF